MEKEPDCTAENKIPDINQLFMAMPQPWQDRGVRIAREAACFFELIIQEELYEEEKILYTPDEIELAVLYHDIGFMKIPEALYTEGMTIADKQNRAVQNHTIYGADMIKQYWMSHSFSDRETGIWRLTAEIAIGHHERWDGKGYPHGEVATAISLISRITAIVDCYDSVFRDNRWDSDASATAMQKLKDRAGIYYDPRLIVIFEEVCNHSEKFVRLLKREGRQEESETQDK